MKTLTHGLKKEGETMTTKKYELLKDDTKEAFDGRSSLGTSPCKASFIIAKGELGGYIENESNRSQDGNAWVSDWQNCWDSEEGLSYHDCGEDICCCLSPTNNVTCDICNGKGGWLVCEVCIALEQKKQREGEAHAKAQG